MLNSDEEFPAAQNGHFTKETDKNLRKEEDETESVIQYFLEAYKNYLVQCIDYRDLLFYKHFSPAKRKEFRDLARNLDGESVTAIMIDSILSVHEIPDRFTALVKLFEEEFENEKVLRILKGEKAPSNRLENKERIQRVCMREICENLLVTVIIPKLYEKKLILQREMENLLKRARHMAEFEAAVDLLLILPSRHCNWYAIFMYCLIDTGHDKLAEKVDPDLYQRILAEKRQGDTDTESVTSYHMIEKMSLVSGTMPTCRKGILNLKLNRDKEITPQNNPSDAKDKVERVEEKLTPGSDTTRRKRSPSEERVANWVMSSDNAITKEGDGEHIFSKSRLLKRLRRKLVSRRRGSLIEKSASRTGSGSTKSRYTTMHVPFNQTQGTANMANEPTNVNRSRESFWSEENDVNRSSDISSIDGRRSLSNLQLELIHTNRIPLEESFSKVADVTIETKDRNEDRGGRSGTGSKRPSFFPTLELVFAVKNLHPAKISLILKEHPELYDTVKLLTWMSNRAIFYEDLISSLKYHYICTVIQQAKATGNIDDWMHKLLTGRESDGFYEYQDQLVRDAVDGFSLKESSLIQNILTQLHVSPLGDGLTSLKILIQSLKEGSTSMEEQPCGYTHVGIIPSQRNKRIRTCSSESFNTLKAYISDEELTPNEPLYQSIKEWIAKVCSTKCYYDRIIGIKTVRNKSLLEKYKQETEKMATGTPGKLNERYLFCSTEFLPTIIKGELNDLMCQNDVYLAEDPIMVDESSNYGTLSCSKCSGCERYMLLCRVCLGSAQQICSDDFSNNNYFVKVQHNARRMRCPMYRVKTANQVCPEYIVILSPEYTNDLQSNTRGKGD